MGAVLTVNQGSTHMVRLVNGRLVQEEAQQNLYMIPPADRYEFEITGYALPFEMRRNEKFIKPGDSPTQTMTRLELTVTEGKGKGKMFTLLFGYTIGMKSNLGKFLRALNVDLTPNERGEWDLDAAVGYRGVGEFKPTDSIDEQTKKPKGVVCAIDFVKPISAPERPYTIDIGSQELEPAMAGATNGNGNHTSTTDDGWA